VIGSAPGAYDVLAKLGERAGPAAIWLEELKRLAPAN
jgi:hypothetical protein